MEIKRNVVSKFLLLWVVGMLLSVQVFAQGFTVKGVVKDNTGMGVIGANILVKGTTNGTITDFDGNFTLEPQIRNPTKVSERCGPNRQECDFSSLD